MSLAAKQGLPDVLSAERDGLRKLRLLMLVLGVVLIAVGLVAMSSVFIATLASVVILGILFLTGGVVSVVNAFWVRRWRGFWVNVLAGILYLVVGFLMTQRPLASAAAFTLMIAAVLFIGGLFRIAASRDRAVSRLDVEPAQRRHFRGPGSDDLAGMARIGLLGHRPLRRHRHAVRRLGLGDDGPRHPQCGRETGLIGRRRG